jgi:hypothetical protein
MKLGAFNGNGNRNSFSGGRGRFLTYTHDDDLWETKALDYAACNLAEGAVCVNPKGLDCNATSACINGQPAHPIKGNPCENDGHRIKVVVRNNDTSALCDVTGDLSDEAVTDNNFKDGISVWVYDTWYSNLDFCLLGNNDGVELSDMIDHALVVVSHTNNCPDSISIECCEVKHRLSLTDLSVPVEDLCLDYRSCDSRKWVVHKDVHVTQFNNYGLRLDGKGNPVLSANIQLNGHDRFDEQEGSYFNYYQTYHHHTRTPADGVNVYSFALYPEKHQPSGTTNLSRIDSTILNLNIADTLRLKNRLKLDIARDTDLYIFAWSYNVLRIMSGMGGLAYSN